MTRLWAYVLVFLITLQAILSMEKQESSDSHGKDIWDMLIPLKDRLGEDGMDQLKYHYMLQNPKAEGIYMLMKSNQGLQKSFLQTQEFDVFRMALAHQDDEIIESFLQSPRLVNWNFMDPIIENF